MEILISKTVKILDGEGVGLVGEVVGYNDNGEAMVHVVGAVNDKPYDKVLNVAPLQLERV